MLAANRGQLLSLPAHNSSCAINNRSSLPRVRYYTQSRRLCLKTTSSQATASRNRDALLQWVSPDNRKDVARILEVAEQAVDRWEVLYTDFISPAVLADAMSALSQQADICAVPWGGYAQAERCRIAVGREDLLETYKLSPETLDCVAAVEVKGNFLFDPAKHPDFLGAILGTGVVREKVGDILVQGETGAQILVNPDLLDHFEMTLTQVRSVPVKVQRIAVSDLKVRPPKVEEISSVESSLRLDAVASAGFRVSRSKMTEMIKAGDVRINWKQTVKPTLEVKQGDIISCAGKGRIEVKQIETTKKEKYAISITRFI